MTVAQSLQVLKGVLFVGHAALYMLQVFGKGQYEDCPNLYLNLTRRESLTFVHDTATVVGKCKASSE